MPGAVDVDCLVVGAGVVGLAIARALARDGREVVVAEATGGIGHGISSRNSEVIHAGIYYPPGSLKARLCIEGREALYAFCKSHGVPHRQCGKIIVAAGADQARQLEAIRERAAKGGVGLEPLDRTGLMALEPQIEGVIGLHSPRTGIVDSHALMLALQGDAQANGAACAFLTPMLSARATDRGIAVALGGPDACEIVTRHLVIAAGLEAPALGARVEGIAPASLPQRHFAKGNYFALAGKAPFSRLVYPAPEPGGLGVHLTLDLAGRARFGPDVEWLETNDPADIDYAVNPARGERFYAAIRRYWPGLPDGALVPDYSGVRPKIAAPGQPDADFVIQDAADHGIAGLVALYGIESPGLTSALAIADHVTQMIARN